MINNIMQKETKEVDSGVKVSKPTPPQRQPQEQYGLHFSSHIRITDPDTGKVVLSKRCD